MTTVSKLQDHVLHYAQVTATDLIAHLVDTYSNITSEVLEQNCDNITAEWNPNNGIKTIFMLITTANHQFAAVVPHDSHISFLLVN
jgi:hypothetical protein